ncbi:MAG: hypothetical protein DME78_00120 [Verrucomicrobia bacterium]|nr:MAG: hypothetical protein DME78_00120 [Verrucomicrobiota bacterium]
MKHPNIIFNLFALGCFALCPMAQALNPPPDGGYPRGNTAEGTSALASPSTGAFNTAVGFLSLQGNTESSFNTAVGAGALLANTAFNNTAIGAGALLSNSTGEENTANGAFALFSNTEGLFNTAVGAFALLDNTTGFQNTAIGNSALVNNTEGNFNIATGDLALFDNTTGDENTANGEAALGNNTEGRSNTAIGANALRVNISGDDNTAVGHNALSSNTDGNNNVALAATPGLRSRRLATLSASGILVPTWTTAVLSATSTKSRSVTIGFLCWSIPLENWAPAYRRGDSSTASNQWTKPAKPSWRSNQVTFHYKTDNTHTPQFGLIAEEVAEVNPNLVVRDKNGEIYSVRYDAVNAMLLNEFLKEHKKVQEHQATIAELKSIVGQQQNEMETVIARVKAQAAQIQKVSARIDANKFDRRTAGRIRRDGPAPQMAINP